MWMYADSRLNLAWAGVSVAAFLWFLISGRHRHSCYSRRALMCQALALGLALVSLFPCISASDDAARLALLNAQLSSDSGGQWSGTDDRTDTQTLATLVGLLETLESSQIAVVILLNIVLSLFAFAFAARVAGVDRFLPSCAGRAPPLSSVVSL
jgi:hypothetical protein